uniref:CarD family transcriptional regulator n=1 Tax=Oribacterium sinus TaxID=237576 RepID=UPI0028E7AFA4
MHNLEKMPEEGILLPKNPASKTRIFFELTEALEKKEPLFVEGISDSLKSLLALGFRGKWILYLCKTEERAKEILQDGKIFAENCVLFPAKDYLFYKADTRGNYISRERSECLRQLVEEEEGMVVTTLPAMLEKLEGKNAFRQAVFTVQLGQTLSLESLQDSLHSLGYQRVDQVESRGEYSLRGGILDVFSNQMEEPLRIEFFDDEVDSLRYFSLESQRSLEQVEEANIYPVSEQGKPSSLKAFSLLDYLPKDCLVIVDEPVRVLEEGKRVEEEFIAYFSQRAEVEKAEAESQGRKKGKFEKLEEEKDQTPLDLFSVRTLMEECASRPIFFFSSLGGLSEWSEVFENPLKSISVECREIPFYGKQFAQFKGDMEKYKKEKVRISLYSPSQSRASRLAEELRQEGLSAYCPDTMSEDREEEENPGSIRVLPQYLRKGFYLPQEKILVMTEQDLYGQSLAGRKRRKKKQVESLHIGSLTELHKGDYVVHESHGIGIYEGIERIVTDGVSKDYLKILYGDGGNLYLPVNKLDGIEKYAGKEAKAPKLNRLNGSEWQKTKSKVKGAVREIAKELLALYAKRQQERGYPFGKDTVWQREFEEAFPYEETGDQLL